MMSAVPKWTVHVDKSGFFSTAVTVTVPTVVEASRDFDGRHSASRIRLRLGAKGEVDEAEMDARSRQQSRSWLVECLCSCVHGGHSRASKALRRLGRRRSDKKVADR